MDTTMHQHELYHPRYTRAARDTFRQKERIDSIDQYGDTYAEQHMRYHFGGIPQARQTDENAVELAAQALRDTSTNFTAAWRELEAQQPHIVSAMLELSSNDLGLPREFWEWYEKDITPDSAERLRTRVVGGMLAADRMIQSWNSDVVCRLSDCPVDDYHHRRPGGTPIVPLNAVLGAMYDDQLRNEGWFDTIVRNHLQEAFARLTDEEKMDYWHWVGTPSSIESHRFTSNQGAVLEQKRIVGRYAILFADAFAVVNPGMIRIRADEPLPIPRPAKGSY